MLNLSGSGEWVYKAVASMMGTASFEQRIEYAKQNLSNALLTSPADSEKIEHIRNLHGEKFAEELLSLFIERTES